MGKIFFELNDFERCDTKNVFMTLFNDLESKNKIDKKMIKFFKQERGARVSSKIYSSPRQKSQNLGKP